MNIRYKIYLQINTAYLTWDIRLFKQNKKIAKNNDVSNRGSASRFWLMVQTQDRNYHPFRRKSKPSLQELDMRFFFIIIIFTKMIYNMDIWKSKTTICIVISPAKMFWSQPAVSEWFTCPWEGDQWPSMWRNVVSCLGMWI